MVLREQRKKVRQKHLKKSSNKSWSNNTQNIKETDPQDNLEKTRRTGLIVNYKEEQNIPGKEHKLNLSGKTDVCMYVCMQDGCIYLPQSKIVQIYNTI